MLSLQEKLWIIKQKKLGGLTVPQIAVFRRVSRMTVHRIWVSYKSGGGLVNRPLGRSEE